MDEMGVVRELKVVSVVGTQLCELGGKVGWVMQGVVCEAWSLWTTARETRRNVVACLAPDRHSCSHDTCWWRPFSSCTFLDASQTSCVP